MDLAINVTEDQLELWASAPSESEETKCQNAVRQIKKVIEDRFGASVSVFLQGSYRNRTNVKRDSDVDIVVRHDGIFFPDISGLTEQDKVIYNSKNSDANYTFPQFKSDVQAVLEQAFQYGEVARKDKCIRVQGNTYRVNADVVPCFTHKRFGSPFRIEAEGIEFLTEGGQRIKSFPTQHIENGQSKNLRTNGKYKSVVRILKNVENILLDRGRITKELMPSFFLECLVWNVPDSDFNQSTLYSATRNVIIKVYNDMKDEQSFNSYAEVSDLKWLFKGAFHRNPEHAKQFMQEAWTCLGYK